MADNDTTDAREVVITLRALIGTKLVAHLGHSTDTRAVNGWSDGTLPVPTADLLERLRIASAAAQILTRRDSPAVAQTWFQGRNAALGDRSPAQVLRDAGPDVVLTSILRCRRRIRGAQHLLNAPNERQGRNPISVNLGRCNRTNLSADPQ